jgi:hypothetical protein
MHYELRFFRKSKIHPENKFFTDYFTEVALALKFFSIEMQKAAINNDFYFVSAIKLVRIVNNESNVVATWERSYD